MNWFIMKLNDSLKTIFKIKTKYMINLRAAAKTALLIAIILLIGKFVLTFPLFTTKIILIVGGIWGASVIYRWFDESDKN